MTMRLFIDRDGSVWSAYDEALVERCGYPDPDFDLPSFAVRNLGAVDVSVDQGGCIETCRPHLYAGCSLGQRDGIKDE